MRSKFLLAGVVFCLPLVVGQAADDVKPDNPKPEPKAEVRKDYAEFSALIHKMVVKEVPRYYEELSGWGQTIPIPPKLRFPNLQRTKIRVGDHDELPHGLWKRYKVRLQDPNKDIRIVVRDFVKLEGGKFRVVVDSDANLLCEGELKHWQNGISLLGATAQADAVLAMSLVCDVDISLNTKMFPPDVIVQPKVTDLKLDLKEFNLRRIGSVIEIEGERAKNLGNEVKDVLRNLIKSQEGEVKNRANEAIAASLKEGRGNISAAAILKLPVPGKSKEKERKEDK